MIAQVMDFYFEDGARIADVTFGMGAFWRKTDLKRIRLLGTDIKPQSAYKGYDKKFPDVKITGRIDFRHLPYRARSFDGVVFDPPYMHNPGRPMYDTYNNAETTSGMYHRDIMQLYADGMADSVRVLKYGGLLFVKCKDEIESGRQCWSHVEVLQLAEMLKLVDEDLFVLVQSSKPVIQHSRQLHARKNHSYLWVFRKPVPKGKKGTTKIRV